MRLRLPRPAAGPATTGADHDQATLGARLLPAVLAGLLVLATLAMTVYSFHANRRDALHLTDETLALLEERIVAEVTAFLSVPERALSILAEFAGDRAIQPHERQAAVESATALLRVAPMLALVGFADADGNWLMVRRDPATGALETKTIAMEGGVRRAFWTRRAANDAEPVIEDDPADRFDPRTRPWWRLAEARPGISWTDLYVFFTDREPGVSAVRPLRAGAVPGAVMVDVRLTSLSEFLARLTVGRTGRALVLDGEGRLVAIGDPARRVEVRGEALSPARLYQLDDPVLSRAFDLFRAEGPGRHVVEVDGKDYIMMAARLPGEGRTWNLLMAVPQDDFIGFVRRNSLVVLAIAQAVVLLAALLAWSAIRQARRAGRARAALRRQAALSAEQGALFAELASADRVGDVLNVVGKALAARRVGLWRLAEGGQVLQCEAQADATAGTQGAGITLRRADAPKLFATLEAGIGLDVADAAADPRTAELARLYLRPVGSRALRSVPLRSHPTAPLIGALWIEDPGASAVSGQTFAATAAAMLARLIGPAPAAPTGGAAAAVGAARARSQALMARLRERLATEEGKGDAQVFPRLAVLVLAITDDAAVIGARLGPDETLVGRIRRTVLAAAGAATITCLRSLGERIMLADGFTGDAEQAARRLGDVAIAIQDRLTDAFTEAGLGLEFRMGLDLGPAAGARDPHAETSAGPGDDWNLFGEAVATASSLAETAPPGAIQVSESAQAALSTEFLLRARGRFFVRDAGEIGTWLVAGHA